jgi:tetratricopeptide (TPR) repeat protein
MVLPVEGKAAVDPIVDLAIKHNYKKRVSQINIVLGQYYYFFNEKYPKALEYLEAALKIGEELNDLITLILASNVMGYCLSDKGEFEKALSCYEKALEITITTNVPWGVVAQKAQTVILVYFRQGNVQLAHQTSREALRIADEGGDMFSRSYAYTAHGCSYLLKGFLDKAEEHFLKAVDFQQKGSQLAYAAFTNFFLAETYLSQGEYEQSQKHCERAISWWQQCRTNPSYIIMNKIIIVYAKVMNKEKDINLNEVFKWYEDIKSKWVEGLISNCIGAILLNIDEQHIFEAENWIIKAIQTNEKYGMMWNLGQDYALYSDLYKRKGEPSKAREKLNKAIEIFEACGADGWVERCDNALSIP